LGGNMMEDNNKSKVYKIIMLIIMTALVTFMITSIGMYNFYTKTSKGKQEIIQKIEIPNSLEALDVKIQGINEYLDDYYIGEIDKEKMIESAVKGYVEGLQDAYTEYLTKEEYDELIVSVKGDYVGIGIYMTMDSNNNIVVLMPIEGSPAEKEGLETGDIILSINGESCSEMDLNIASIKIKGEENTTVDLEIQRGTDILNKTIERKTVEIADSRAEVLENNIGYIELTVFDEGCAENIERYLRDFQNKGIKSVILDLRNNTGGIVSEAIELSELFVGKGNVIMRSYDKKNQETVITSSKEKMGDFELVILVNEYSASATEIVSAALQDNKAATIVGTTTFGKGVMQEILPIFNKTAALKITIEEFKTPNGNKINKVGITPDVEVELDSTSNADTQLQKAIELLSK
jgi:carboxyl-terminal processing protease